MLEGPHEGNGRWRVGSPGKVYSGRYPYLNRLLLHFPVELFAFGHLDPNNPDYQHGEQHINIKAAIKLHEDWEMNGGEHVFVMDGIVVSEETLTGKPWSWDEGT
jgi:hypothetical protein